ncbi:DUF4974 domain-containing protein [Maribellus sp. CM-23]|uniref:FecR family protein n=1 Tax=Maribellus sp. CM-23 TaxID=2781026 RepID=UPI001F3EAD4A|nr:FecR domain-containing protein [Maribellus sp. CM-23]MCE4565829.1 DUF4974 domain-containing protein [Maribellus sp. CM-23]
MTLELLNKYLQNKLSGEELQEVLHWIRQEALTEDERKLALADWENYRAEDTSESDTKFVGLFDRIQDEIERREKKTRLLPAGWLLRAAAILLLPVLAVLFYTLTENISIKSQYTSAAADSLEIIAPIGSRSVVQLSDGSQVHLNYGSKIRYPLFFSGETRDVVLEGEGFFEVAHNPEKPFIVKVGDINVKALGTEFNVLAYPEDNVIQTTLVNGKVVLEQSVADGESKLIGSMVPGQHVKYNWETEVISSSKGSVERYIAWKDGKLIFEDTPISEMAEKLSRMFNVDIEVDKEVEDFIYTVTFIDEPLSQILDLMTIATPVRYTSLPRKKLPNGTYSKQKIIITKKE